jgi:protein-S-isoprenylcysteine O-methyltransferase Ste14
MTSEILFRILFWLLILAMFVMRGFFMLRVRSSGEQVMPDRDAVKREGTVMFLFRFIGFFALIGLLAAYALYPAWISALSIPFPDWLRWTGFAIALAGFVLGLWSQVALGTEWSAQLQLREKHRIIASGPYARMRHPMYTSLLLWGTGLALLSANWIFVAVAVLASAMFVARVPREEQMMIDQFGDEYRDYMNRTGRLFPRF